MNSILELQNEFPKRLQHAIREAADNQNSNNRNKTATPKLFLSQVQDAFADWLFEAALFEDLSGCLNDTRDTEQQVEMALRFFPQVLRIRRYGLFPIFWLCRSIRSVSFIPLFAKLGVELGLFQEYERGGLVFGANGMDIFSQLAATTCRGGSTNTTTNKYVISKRNHQDMVDATFLAVIQTLRKNKLMKKSDIYKYKMIDILCNNEVYFPKKRFLYLVDWDPSALLSNNSSGRCDKSTKNTTISLSVGLISRFLFADTTKENDNNDLTGLRMLFELSMKYYPAELGFLFDTIYSVDNDKKPSSFRKKMKRKHSKKRGLDEGGSNHSQTGGGGNENGSDHFQDTKVTINEGNSTSLFQFACDTHGKEVVQGIVDDLFYVQMKKDVGFTRRALLRAATAPCDNDTETEGGDVGGAEVIFFLMQRDPSLLLLHPTTTTKRNVIPLPSLQSSTFDAL